MEKEQNTLAYIQHERSGKAHTVLLYWFLSVSAACSDQQKSQYKTSNTDAVYCFECFTNFRQFQDRYRTSARYRSFTTICIYVSTAKTKQVTQINVLQREGINTLPISC